MTQTNGHAYVSSYEEGVTGRATYAGERPYGPSGYAMERPLGELFQELTEDARNLVSLEVALAKTELSEKVAQAGKSAGFMAGGGFIIYAGFLAIMLAVILGLSYFIPLWLSALIVGVVVALVGFVLLRKGMNDLKANSLAPQRTIQSLKEEKDWIQNQVR